MALEMMKDALDYIYGLMKLHFSGAYMPPLYIIKREDVNAFALATSYTSGMIFVTHGLIQKGAELIEQRYRNEIFQRYGLLKAVDPEIARSGIRVYLWRYIVLHELYHLWDRHSVWKKKYKFNENGELISRTSINANSIDNDIIAETVTHSADCDCLTDEQIQSNLTQQVLELDADSSAVCMLVNLMMIDTDARVKAGSLREEDKKGHIQIELALMMGALSAAFCLFDGNAGAKFDKLSNLKDSTHPIPSIRMLYAEEIADGCLHYYFKDTDEITFLELEWQKLICDVDADYNGKVDFGQVFYFTAYTRAAQEHLSILKKRMIAIYDTLQPLALCNFAEKLADEDAEVDELMIWFDDNGHSLKGWGNISRRRN